MTIKRIRAAFESHLKTMKPVISTAWENLPFKPVHEEPFQAVFMLFDDPDNSEFSKHYQQSGFMQVSLMYPLSKGTGSIEERAELFREKFFRGLCLYNDDLMVMVTDTPSIGPSQKEEDRFMLPVRIRFNTYIQQV